MSETGVGKLRQYKSERSASSNAVPVPRSAEAARAILKKVKLQGKPQEKERATKRGQPGSVSSEGGASRQLILDVSASLFSSQGYTETSMRQIATKVGMQTASLYYHFASKELILSEILRLSILSVASPVTEALESLPGNWSPAQRLLHAIEAHARAAYLKPDYTSTAVRCAGQIPRKTARAASPLRDKYENVWRTLFDDAAAANQIREGINVSILRPFILHSLNRTLAWFDPKRGNVEDLVRILCVSCSSFLVEKPKPSRPK